MSTSKASIGGITTPRGFYAAATTCGLKESGLADLSLIVADRPCAAAGVFTKSRTFAAPVAITKRHLKSGQASAIVVNSGNANASTGQQGQRDAIAMCQLLSEQLAQRAPKPPVPPDNLPIKPNDILVSSTGIIGQPLPMERIARGIATAASRLERSRAVDDLAARAIITTDLVTKQSFCRIKLAGKTVNIAGIAKGSGMIAPNMATMLCFITTDAAITPAQLRNALSNCVATSFNRISVDQHTSPSDMVLALASSAADNPRISRRDASYKKFELALGQVCSDLAYQIVKDGEGATKVFRVNVVGSKTQREADRVAKAIVDSPLVKTAVHGGDPNWGRIITAAGYSGAAVQQNKMSLHIGSANPVCVLDHGMPAKLSRTTERRLAGIMSKKEITLTLDLSRGRATTQWLGCDLSRQYVAINADYTT